jgi:short-subunit dehydrogenase
MRRGRTKAFGGGPKESVTSATKIFEALSQELAPLGIFSTVVEPGFFRTDFLDEKSLSRTQNEGVAQSG